MSDPAVDAINRALERLESTRQPPAFDQEAVIDTMELPALSPLLTLLDALLDHKEVLVQPAVADEQRDTPAVLDLCQQYHVFGRFLKSTSATLSATLAALQLTLCNDGPSKLWLERHGLAGAALTHSQVLRLIRLVEVRLAIPDVALNRLQRTAEEVLRLCRLVSAGYWLLVGAVSLTPPISAETAVQRIFSCCFLPSPPLFMPHCVCIGDGAVH